LLVSLVALTHRYDYWRILRHLLLMRLLLDLIVGCNSCKLLLLNSDNTAVHHFILLRLLQVAPFFNNDCWIIKKNVTIRIVDIREKVRTVWLFFHSNVILIKECVILNVRAVETFWFIIWNIMICILYVFIIVCRTVLWVFLSM
jgi:hypothetical protein